MPNKDTTPLSLYGNDREYLREQEKTNELLAEIAGEEYESPGDIPNGKYVIQKRLLDAAQKKNELLEAIAEEGCGGGQAAKGLNIDYATDVISLKNKNGDIITGSGATLPAYGVSFDPTTGGLTLTKNGTAVSGQTVTIPNYGSPVGVTDASDMTDEGVIYLYEGETDTDYTNGHFYYYNGTAWADGGEYAAATVQTDKTLLVEDRAADAKATGEAVSEVKTQLESVYDDYYSEDTYTESVEIDAINDGSGVIKTNGQPQTNSSYYHTQKINVSAGEVITAKGYHTDYGKTVNVTLNHICAFNDETADSNSGVDTGTAKSYVVPDNIDGIVISILTNIINVVVTRSREVTEYHPVIDEVNERMSDNFSELIGKSEKKLAYKFDPTIVPEHWVNKSGTEYANENYNYFVIDNLQAGDVIIARRYYQGGSSILALTFAYVCAYDAGGSAKSAKGADGVKEYTVPEDIVKVAISYNAVSHDTIESVVIFRDGVVKDIYENENLGSAVFGAYPQEVTSNLSASSVLALNTNCVKKNFSIFFKAKIDSFNELIIARGGNTLNGSRLKIDSTNVTLYNGDHENDTPVAVNAHGLTFSDYIFVSIRVGDDRTPNIFISTTAGKYEYSFDTIKWVGCAAKIDANTDANTVLTDCVLSFVCLDIKQPVWIFGDSYVSYSVERWPFWVHKMGYDGYLLNGYSGETSAYAVQNLRNLLQFGTPKYIIWAMGMNDKDGADAVSSIWISCYNEVVALCNEFNITLIPCTIPNVPERSHIYKNDIIVNSGYQYIDFASAVGAFDDSTWYDGMLAGGNDNVHPTQTGAYALASEVLKDFPYIAIR